jgi:hypothetical protein
MSGLVDSLWVENDIWLMAAVWGDRVRTLVIFLSSKFSFHFSPPLQVMLTHLKHASSWMGCIEASHAAVPKRGPYHSADSKKKVNNNARVTDSRSCVLAGAPEDGTGRSTKWVLVSPLRENHAITFDVGRGAATYLFIFGLMSGCRSKRKKFIIACEYPTPTPLCIWTPVRGN